MLIFIISISTLFFLLLIYSFYFFLKLYYRRNQDFLTELQKVQYDNEKRLLTMQIEVQEKTFENISREIHDNIGQKLSLAKLHLHTLGTIENKVQNDKLLAAVKLISSSIVDMGDISRAMNADFISHYGIIKVLELEILQLSKLTRYDTKFELTGEQIFLTPQKELVIFRVVQEALNNIIKHADCNKIGIHMDYGKTSLKLKITDNGKGYDMDNSKSIGAGLINMKKRTGTIEADLKIESKLELGTTIIITIPYGNERQKN